MGQLFWEAGLKTVFVDADPSLVRHLNERRRYPLRLLDAYTKTMNEMTIDGFKVIGTDRSTEITEAIAEAHIAATAVGVANLEPISPLLAAGIRRRFERGSGPLDIYLCENTLGAADLLRERVLGLLDGPAEAWADAKVGFVGTSVARIVGGAGARGERDDPLLVVADAHRDIPYDGKAGRAGAPGIEGFHPVNNFKAEVERKIFTHNLAHAALAYLGYLRGHTYIHETFADDFISAAFEGALDETTEALLRRYPADLDRREHLAIRKDVRVRFGNPLLNDPVTRVAKDPIRKLGPDDRLIGSAKLCLAQNIPPDRIALVCAAALCYDCPDDPQAVHLRQTIEQVGVQEALRRISGLEPTGDLGRMIIAYHHDLRNKRARQRH